MHDNQSGGPLEGYRRFLGGIAFVARAFAVSVEVFLHRADSFGERYLGLQAGASLLLIFFWPVLCEPHHDPTPMICFAGLFVLSCMLVRVRVFLRRRRGGPQPHTRYSGTPDLVHRFKRLDEVKVKQTVEPFMTFAIGAVILNFSPPLGGYLMIASAGLLISNGLAAEYERRRVSDMHDAYLEQRGVAERFRDMRGE
ncbi:MraY-like glycosyltransferase [Phycisphaerae bacterium RAS1]|nr:MraY-like glycosyltransferase [Phycisphaerae bacterium RAS1]